MSKNKSSFERSINQRLKISDKKKLIIHTDIGRQFSSKLYNMFTKKYKEYFISSMVRENTPTRKSKLMKIDQLSP